MNATLAIIRVMLPVVFGFLMQVFGSFGAREETVLRQFVVKVSVPLMIFHSMYTADVSSLQQLFPMTAAFGGLSLVLASVGLVLGRYLPYTPDRTRAMILCVTFGNYGWIGWAVAESFLGEPGLNRAIFFTLFWWPVFYLLGAFVGADGNLRSLSKTMVRKIGAAMVPTFAAVFAGMALNLTDAELPAVLEQTVSDFGNMTVPLILFSVGLQLRLQSLGALYKEGIIVSLARFGLGALMGIAITGLFRFDSTSAQVIRIESVMPVATVIPVLAEYFEIDQDMATAGIIVSTLMAIPLLPVWAKLLI